MIENVLNKIREQMTEATIPSDVTFTIDDINCIGDLYELGTLKFSQPFPDDFEFSTSRLDSFRRFELGDTSDYRVLEFALISNNVLKNSAVLTVFPWYKECLK